MRVLLLLSFLSLSTLAIAQPWDYNLGTGTGSHTSGASTTFMPTPPSGGGTARVRVGTGSGSFNLENPGNAGIGSGTELRAVAPTGGSVNKFAVYGFNSPSTSYTLKFNMMLGGSAGENVSSGTWYLFVGSGTTYSNDNTFSGSEVFTGLRFVFGAGGTITLNNRAAGAWNATGITGTPFTQGNNYQVEIFGNNSAATINYNYAGGAQSVASNTFDLWVDGTLVGNDLAKGAQSNASTINAFMFYGENSTANAANIFLDDIIYTNTLAAESLPLNWLSFSATKQLNNTVNLDWTTANEVNVSHFEIESSYDGTTFTQVGKMGAKNQAYNSYQVNKPILASSTDPSQSNVYFRIKQVDYDKTASYSDVVLVKGSTSVVVSVYPNPTSSMLVVRGLPNVDDQFGYKVLNLTGQEVARGELSISRSAEPRIDISQLQAGIYFLQIGAESPIRFVKE